MAISKAEGSQAAVISTEHTLATITDAGSYVLSVDMSNLENGDELILKAKVKVRSTGTTRNAYTARFLHSQSDPVSLSIPIASVHEFVVTLEQSAGTGRVFNWEVTEL